MFRFLFVLNIILTFIRIFCFALEKNRLGMMEELKSNELFITCNKKYSKKEESYESTFY